MDHSLSRRDAVTAFAAQYRKYFMARVARIYPLHMVGLVVAAVLTRVGWLPFVLEQTFHLPKNTTNAPPVCGFLAQLLLLQAWFPAGLTTCTAP